MQRARFAAVAAPLMLVSIVGAVLASGGAIGGSLAAVAWPPSTLVVSEVQTGGASASDEFAELTNVGATAVDLNGLEVVYVTSTGGTITRKASWASSLLLSPGRHLLIANTSGIYAPQADAIYSGGLAATGGAIVLRAIGGTTVDAVGWGDATNAFVEGSAAAAPAASSSIERNPGGSAGNTIDTNSNSADFFVQAVPNPQPLSAAPVPAPSPSPSPTATPTPTATAIPTPTAVPTPTPTPTPGDTSAPTVAPTDTPEPTPEITPTPAPTPEPTLAPTPEPTATQTPTPTPSPTSSPTPLPPPTVVTIAAARGQLDGTTATIEGTLTTALGALESGRTGFIQDASGGISLYLDAASADPLPIGTVIQATGTVDDRYAQRTLRVSWAGVVVLGAAAVPDALVTTTGSIAEPLEGLRVEVAGTTVGSPTAYADGLGILVDDGTGPVRVIVGANALGAQLVPSGTQVIAIGPVGQHDSSGTGTTAYRIQSTEVGELTVVIPEPSPTPTATPPPTSTPAPTPTPTPSPMPSSTATPTAGPTASPTPTPTSTPTPTPSPTPSPSPSSMPIGTARGLSIGSVVTVSGVVTADAGRLGTPPLFAIQDASGGIVVRLPDGAAVPARGASVLVTGPLADPYGQLEIRPAAGGVRLVGTTGLPTPLAIGGGGLGEATEAKLVQLTGTASSKATKETSGDIAIDLADAAGHTFRVFADASSGISVSDLPVGRAIRITGIVGQRASRKGALDGYRIWLRDRADIVLVGGPNPSPSAAPMIGIGAALRLADGAAVAIEASVIAGPSLLDSTGRRIVVQDPSGAIEVLLPTGTAAPRVGSVLRITGVAAHAWGAPRIRATLVADAHANLPVSATARAGALGEADEWHLVRLTGVITKVEKLGDRWRADLRIAGAGTVSVPVLGLAGAGIPSTAVLADHVATITGIAKRPYPTATDRRFGLVPRGPSDLAIGPATSAGSGSPEGSGSGSGGGSGSIGGSGSGSGALGDVVDATADTDLSDLAAHVGKVVKVGGLIASLTADGFVLDDGTATARIVLGGDALELLSHLMIGDALAATGTVTSDGSELAVHVASASDLVRVGDLGQAIPIASDDGAIGSPIGSDVAGAGSGDQGPTLASTHSFDTVVAPFGVVAMLGLSAVSLAFTLFRRQQERRRLRRVIVARLAALRSASPTGAGRLAARTTRLTGTSLASEADRTERESSVQGAGIERDRA